MIKKTTIILTTIIISTILSSCFFIDSINGNGNVTEETRNLGEFDKISVRRGMNVYISQGESFKIVVKADENLLKFIDTSVDNGTLKVTSTRSIRNATSNKVYVTIPEIKLIKTTAGSNVFSESTLNTKNLELKSTAGSNVHLTLEAGEMNISAVAGSNIFLDGSAESLNIKANSGSNIKAGDFHAEICTVKASSGANIWINVQKELNASVGSGANLFYFGEPNPLEIEKSSGGNVFKK